MKKILTIVLALVVILTVTFIGGACKKEAITSKEEVAEVTEEEVTEEEVEEAVEKELIPVVWGLDSFLASLPQHAAKELGYFEEEGIDIEFRISALGVETLDQIIAQDIDIGIAVHWALVNRMAQPNIGLGGILCDYNTPTLLMATKEIEELSDLKGKTIAALVGSHFDFETQKALTAGGLTEADVTLSGFGSPVDYLSAALKEDIDAGWFYEANLIKAKEVLEPLGWHSIFSLQDVVPEVTKGFYILPLSFKAVDEKPEALAGAIRAYKRGVDWIASNPEEAAELASKVMGMSVEDATVLIPDFGFTIGFTKSIVDLIREMKEFALQKEYISNDYNFDEKIILEPMEIAFPETIEKGILE